MKRVYIVTVDDHVEIATLIKDIAINRFKECLKIKGIEFDVFAPNVRIRMFSDVCRITYNYIDDDNVQHSIRVHTEYLDGID